MILKLRGGRDSASACQCRGMWATLYPSESESRGNGIPRAETALVGWSRKDNLELATTEAYDRAYEKLYYEALLGGDFRAQKVASPSGDSCLVALFGCVRPRCQCAHEPAIWRLNIDANSVHSGRGKETAKPVPRGAPEGKGTPRPRSRRSSAGL